MLLVVDTHAHLYDEYELKEALVEASRNLLKLKEKLNAPKDATLALFLVDRYGQNSFDMIRKKIPSYVREETPLTMFLQLPTNEKLLLIRGYQIVTRERLEVLALCSRKRVSDGNGFSETIKECLGESSAVVLPWSFGKWMFGRGIILLQFLLTNVYRAKNENLFYRNIFLGDILRRNKYSPSPFLLSSQFVGRNILRGSDPLPGKENQQYLGRDGNLIEFSIEQNRFDVLA
jgi:hypothetical protein